MRIAAFDPGGTTGCATMTSWMLMVTREEIDLEEHHLELFDFLNTYTPDVVVYEKFDRRANMAASTIALEYIGVIKLYCQSNLVLLVGQSASEGKAFWTNDKIKAIGLWKPSSKHAIDATRHLLTYLQKTNQLPSEYLEALKPSA